MMKWARERYLMIHVICTLALKVHTHLAGYHLRPRTFVRGELPDKFGVQAKTIGSRYNYSIITEGKQNAYNIHIKHYCQTLCP